MLCECVRDVMDFGFSVCIVRRGVVGACVWAVLNAAFCMTCSLLMLVEDARGVDMEESYSRASLITAL